MNKQWIKDALKANEYNYPVATDLTYYGPEATKQDVEDYDNFAQEYLSKICGHTVETYRVLAYRSDDPLYDVRQHVWEQFCWD